MLVRFVLPAWEKDLQDGAALDGRSEVFADAEYAEVLSSGVLVTP